MAKTILIIDDEIDFGDFIKIRLEAAGYKILSALDGKSGVEAARRNGPDVILLDLVMPGMDGVTALSELKRDPYTANIPVVVLTAKSKSEYGQDADELGAVEYLSKPVKIEDLERILKKYL